MATLQSGTTTTISAGTIIPKGMTCDKELTFPNDARIVVTDFPLEQGTLWPADKELKVAIKITTDWAVGEGTIFTMKSPTTSSRTQVLVTPTFLAGCLLTWGLAIMGTPLVLTWIVGIVISLGAMLIVYGVSNKGFNLWVIAGIVIVIAGIIIIPIVDRIHISFSIPSDAVIVFLLGGLLLLMVITTACYYKFLEHKKIV